MDRFDSGDKWHTAGNSSIIVCLRRLRQGGVGGSMVCTKLGDTAVCCTEEYIQSLCGERTIGLCMVR